jgi:hypothetical protein
VIIPILSGLAAGSAHVVTGPDHLAALAPIAADQPRRAAALGVRWGLGHGLGVIVLGALGIGARSAVDIDAISAISELIVGFLLVAMGLWALRRAARMVVHSHGHHHDDGEHAHLHVHANADAHDTAAHGGHAHAAFLVGMLHGAAGAGHLFGVLPSLALPTLHAVAYLVAYFIAAVLSMGIFGALMGRFVRNWGQDAMRRVMYGVSTIAVGVGAVWIVQAWPG